MKKYKATSKNIRNTLLSDDFVRDIMYCETNKIPIKAIRQKYGSESCLSISRYDGGELPSGQPSWNHNNAEWNILEEWQVIELPEDLFTL